MLSDPSSRFRTPPGYHKKLEGGYGKRDEGSDSITDHIRTFLKAHLENKLFEPVIFPL